MFALNCFAAAQDSGNAKLTGLVTDISGAAIPETSVLLIDLEAVDAVRVFSDKAGRFEILRLHAGHEYELRLQAPSFKRIVQRTELKPGDNALTLTLNVLSGGGIEVQGANEPTDSRQHGIQGTVIDPAGAVVVGANLLAILQDGSEWRKTKTDEHGYFMFRNLQTGAYQVIAGNPSNERCFQAVDGWVNLKSSDLYPSLPLQLKLSERRCPSTIEVTGPNHPIVTK